MSATQVHLTPGLTLIEAYQVAQAANMHLISNGYDVKVSPIIPPGWRAIPLRVKIASPTHGNVCTSERAAA